jgi:hypothetical protein
MNPSDTVTPVIEEFDVITYKDAAVFKYTLPGEDKEDEIEREIILVWEDTFEKFLEETNKEKPYKINSFKNARAKERFIASIEDETEKIIDEVSELISQRTKFGFEYTSPTYED